MTADNEGSPPPRWWVIGQSVRGASHARAAEPLPNQDAIAWPGSPEPGDGPPVILAVADGHGSQKYFRSQIGSRLAVEQAVHVLNGFLVGLRERGDEFREFSVVKRAAEEGLPREIYTHWLEAVKRHLDENPMTAAEEALLGVPAPEADGDVPPDHVKVTARRTVAYGATILAVLITDSYLIYVQLGDGDIIEVNEAGQTTRPMPPDERLIGNDTTSLCMKNAWDYFRVHVAPVGLNSPVMILLTTDGYANSFPASDEDFLKIGSDYLRMIRRKGASIGGELREILEDTSTRGSGDDITLGLISRLPRVVEMLPGAQPHVQEPSQSVKALSNAEAGRADPVPEPAGESQQYTNRTMAATAADNNMGMVLQEATHHEAPETAVTHTESLEPGTDQRDSVSDGGIGVPVVTPVASPAWQENDSETTVDANDTNWTGTTLDGFPPSRETSTDHLGRRPGAARKSPGQSLVQGIIKLFKPSPKDEDEDEDER